MMSGSSSVEAEERRYRRPRRRPESALEPSVLSRLAELAPLNQQQLLSRIVSTNPTHSRRGQAYAVADGNDLEEHEDTAASDGVATRRASIQLIRPKKRTRDNGLRPTSVDDFAAKYARDDVMLRYMLHVISQSVSVRRIDIPRCPALNRSELLLEDVLFLTYHRSPPCGFRNLYWLEFISENRALDGELEYFTLSSHGLTHFRGASVIDFVDIEGWIQEKRAFDHMTTMRGLQKLQQLLFFMSWKKKAIRLKRRRIRAKLACSLFHCDTVAARLLVEIRSHLITIGEDTHHSYLPPETTFTLRQFATLHRALLKQVASSVRVQVQRIVEIIDRECRAILMARSTGALEQINVGMAVAEQGGTRFLERLYGFIRLTDLQVFVKIAIVDSIRAMAFPIIYATVQDVEDFSRFEPTELDVSPAQSDVFDVVYNMLNGYIAALDAVPLVLSDLRFSHVLGPFTPEAKSVFMSNLSRPSVHVLNDHARQLRDMRYAIETYYKQIGILLSLQCKRLDAIRDAEQTEEQMKQTNKKSHENGHALLSASQYEEVQAIWEGFLVDATKSPKVVQVGFILLDQSLLLNGVQAHVSGRISNMAQELPNVYRQFLEELLRDMDGRIDEVTRIPTSIGEAIQWLVKIMEMMPFHQLRVLFDQKCANLARMKGLLRERGIKCSNYADEELIHRMDIEWESTYETLLICLSRVQERDSEHRRSIMELSLRAEEHVERHLQIVKEEFRQLPTPDDETLQADWKAEKLGHQKQLMLDTLESLVEMDMERENMIRLYAVFEPQIDYFTGREYVGMNRISVVSQLTQRCVFAIMRAIRANGLTLISPTDPVFFEGSTTVVNDVARMLMKPTVVIECATGSLSHARVDNLLQQIVTLDAFAVFDNFARLASSVIRLIQEKSLQMVHEITSPVITRQACGIASMLNSPVMFVPCGTWKSFSVCKSAFQPLAVVLPAIRQFTMALAMLAGAKNDKVQSTKMEAIADFFESLARDREAAVKTFTWIRERIPHLLGVVENLKKRIQELGGWQRELTGLVDGLKQKYDSLVETKDEEDPDLSESAKERAIAKAEHAMWANSAVIEEYDITMSEFQARIRDIESEIGEWEGAKTSRESLERCYYSDLETIHSKHTSRTSIARWALGTSMRMVYPQSSDRACEDMAILCAADMKVRQLWHARFPFLSISGQCGLLAAVDAITDRIPVIIDATGLLQQVLVHIFSCASYFGEGCDERRVADASNEMAIVAHCDGSAKMWHRLDEARLRDVPVLLVGAHPEMLEQLAGLAGTHRKPLLSQLTLELFQAYERHKQLQSKRNRRREFVVLSDMQTAKDAFLSHVTNSGTAVSTTAMTRDGMITRRRSIVEVPGVDQDAVYAPKPLGFQLYAVTCQPFLDQIDLMASASFAFIQAEWSQSELETSFLHNWLRKVNIKLFREFQDAEEGVVASAHAVEKVESTLWPFMHSMTSRTTERSRFLSHLALFEKSSERHHLKGAIERVEVLEDRRGQYRDPTAKPSIEERMAFVMITKVFFPHRLSAEMKCLLRTFKLTENALENRMATSQLLSLTATKSNAKADTTPAPRNPPLSPLLDLAWRKDDLVHQPTTVLIYEPHERQQIDLLLFRATRNVQHHLRLITIHMFDELNLRTRVLDAVTSKVCFAIELWHADNMEQVVTLVSQIISQHALLCIPEWYLVLDTVVFSQVKSTVLGYLHVHVVREDLEPHSLQEQVRQKLVRNGVAEVDALTASSALLADVTRRVDSGTNVHPQLSFALQEYLFHYKSIAGTPFARQKRLKRALLIERPGVAQHRTQKQICGDLTITIESLELLSDFRLLGANTIKTGSKMSLPVPLSIPQALEQLQQLVQAIERAMTIEEESVHQDPAWPLPWWSLRAETLASLSVATKLLTCIKELQHVDTDNRRALQDRALVAEGLFPLDWLWNELVVLRGVCTMELPSIPHLLVLLTSRLGFVVDCLAQQLPTRLDLALVSDPRSFLLAMQHQFAQHRGIDPNALGFTLELASTVPEHQLNKSPSEQLSTEELAEQSEKAPGKTEVAAFVVHDAESQACGLALEGLVLVQRVVSKAQTLTYLHVLPPCQLECKSNEEVERPLLSEGSSQRPHHERRQSNATMLSLSSTRLVVISSLSPYQTLPEMIWHLESPLLILERVALGFSVFTTLPGVSAPREHEKMEFALAVPLFPNEVEDPYA
ncbi:hypothetical protein Poli38472_003409 [Pythium oligandrum]|uniref:Dynein heavy chain hydrolytic ATP-binding dynein motor region domain-containing protein n=1 Tax=Pythium oligandrum TaxID=41045 RepID=A0A8K1C6R6_PYTOL|nr:hypothetical protein Poli38472_003409 [Pythium oligandrum]|eukprot:TMW57484.1 hypothetical protein Poli38472_003409 [Pythium oligandrum]